MSIPAVKTALGYPSPTWDFEERLRLDQLNYLDRMIASRIDKRSGHSDEFASDLTFSANSTLEISEGGILIIRDESGLTIELDDIQLGCILTGKTNPLRFGIENIGYTADLSPDANDFFYKFITKLELSSFVPSGTTYSFRSLFDLNDEGSGLVKGIYNDSSAQLNISYSDALNLNDGYLSQNEGAIIYNKDSSLGGVNEVNVVCDSASSNVTDIRYSNVGTDDLSNSLKIQIVDGVGPYYTSSTFIYAILDQNFGMNLPKINDNLVFRNCAADDIFEVSLAVNYYQHNSYVSEVGTMSVRPCYLAFQNNLSLQNMFSTYFVLPNQDEIGNGEVYGATHLFNGAITGDKFSSPTKTVCIRPGIEGTIVFLLNFEFSDSTKISFFDNELYFNTSYQVKKLNGVVAPINPLL